MNNDLIKKANELHDKLHESPIILNFLALKKQIDNNDELNKLYKTIKTFCHDEKHLDEYILAKNKYHNHPLIINFYNLKEQVEDLLFEIKEILESKQ